RERPLHAADLHARGRRDVRRIARRAVLLRDHPARGLSRLRLRQFPRVVREHRARPARTASAMIHRHTAGVLPAKPHTAFRDADGKLLYEEMFTRLGSSDALTSFSHRRPVTPHREVELATRALPAAIADGT